MFLVIRAAKKCPNCGSSRLIKRQGSFKCRRCGMEHKSHLGE